MPHNLTFTSINNLALRRATILGVFLIIALIGYGMLRYPLIVTEGGVLSVAAPIFMLLFYGVIAAWATQLPNQTRRAALWYGTVFGLIIGAIFIVNISVENFVSMSGRAMTLSTLGFMFLIFFLFAIAGWRGAKDSGQLHPGIFASVWSAMIGTLIALLFGFAINFLFAQKLEQNLQSSTEYIRSGIPDLETFTFYNTLDSASSHLLEVPVIATVFGTIGALTGAGFRRLRQRNNKE